MSRRGTIRTVSKNPGRSSSYTSERQTAVNRDEPCYGGPRHIAVCCGAAVLSSLLVASFQTGFFSVIRPFGVAPDLCLAFTVACGLLFGSRFGALAGAASGFFIEAISSGGIPISIILYLVCGALTGLLRTPEPRPFRDILRYPVVLIAVCVSIQFISALWAILTARNLQIANIFINLFGKNVICTTLFSGLVYLPVSIGFVIFRRIRAAKHHF